MSSARGGFQEQKPTTRSLYWLATCPLSLTETKMACDFAGITPDNAADIIYDKKQRFRVILTTNCFHVLDHASSSFQLRNHRGHSNSKRTSLFESTITPCKCKKKKKRYNFHTFTLRFTLMSLITISIFLLILNFTSDWFVHQSTEDYTRFCRNMSFKLSSFVVFFKLASKK